MAGSGIENYDLKLRLGKMPTKLTWLTDPTKSTKIDRFLTELGQWLIRKLWKIDQGWVVIGFMLRKTTHTILTDLLYYITFFS